jgi:hypothetical protein
VLRRIINLDILRYALQVNWNCRLIRVVKTWSRIEVLPLSRTTL